jgi:exonuclease SbcC
MKPISLKITAFGAFHQEQNIDFEAFNKYGLFLIHGATGAGKTTIFDAMCFALFGGTTSGRDVTTMRSEFASAKENTVVELIFRNKGRYYKVNRSFAVKRNGIDFDKKSFFTEIDGADFSVQMENPITGESDIKDTIKAILGFDVNQFNKIIVLPQGKFSEFLKADSDSKRQLLGKIFDIRTFENIENILSEITKSYKDKIHDLETSINAIQGNQADFDLQNALAEVDSLRIKINTNQVEEARLKAENKIADDILQENKSLFNHFIEYEKTQANLTVHLAEELRFNNTQTRIAQAQKANIVAPEIRLEEQLTVEKQEIIQRIAAIFQEKESVANEFSLKNTGFQVSEQETREKLEKYERRLSELERSLLVFARMQEIAQKRESATQFLERCQEKNSTNERNRSQKKATLTANTQRIRNVLDPAVKDVSHLLVRKNELSTFVDKFDRYAEASKQHTQHKQNCEQKLLVLNAVNDTRISAENEYNTLEISWINSQAARLALQLKPQEPCPVCGAIEHPKKAVGEGKIVSDEQLKLQKEQKEKVTQTYEHVKTAYEETKKQEAVAASLLQETQNALGACPFPDKPSLIAEISKLEQEQKAVTQAQGEKDALIQVNEKLTEEIQQLQQEQVKLSSEIATHQAEINSYAEQLEKKRAELPEKVTDIEDAQKSIGKGKQMKEDLRKERSRQEDELKKLSERLTSLETSSKNFSAQQTELEAKLAAQQTKCEQLCKENDFADRAAVKQAIVEAHELKTLQNFVEKWAQQYHIYKADLERLATLITNKEKPDLAQYEQQANAITEAHEVLLKSIAEDKKILADSEKHIQRLAEENQKLQDLRREAQPYAELSELANGKNTHIKLSTYVVATLLDEVLVYTNRRLVTMSGGRYEIMRIEDIKDVKGRGQKGLELVVLDSYTGTQRRVETLSGGESFFTSLALALGLADVAAAQRGGIQVEALFIDEGFGTLDTETLDRAVGVLTDLESEHKMIGIISHVTELRERVPARLEVVKTNQGSRLVVHLPQA